MVEYSCSMIREYVERHFLTTDEEGERMKSPSNEREKKWAQLFLDGLNATEAARKAGYAESSARVQGYTLKKKYEAWLVEQTSGNLRASGAMAFEILIKLAKSAKHESIRLKAVSTLLAYGGYKPSEKTEITVTDKTSEELDATIIQLLGKEKAEAILNKEKLN